MRRQMVTTMYNNASNTSSYVADYSILRLIFLNKVVNGSIYLVMSAV